MATKIGFLDKPSLVINNELFDSLAECGIEFTDNNAQADFLWNASVMHWKTARREHINLKRRAKVVNYVWDLYEWAWENRRRGDFYDWRGYANYLKESDFILCPNEGTRKRIKEYTERDAHVVHTAITVKDNPRPDGRYVLNPLREYPDPQWGWTKQICEDLDIPYVWSNHQYTQEEWEDLVAGATLLVCEYQEASTGGLTLIEGLWNGIPSIVYDGPYSGGKEYLREYAHLFTTYDELRTQIRHLWTHPREIDTDKARTFIEKEYSYKRMAQQIAEVLL